MYCIILQRKRMLEIVLAMQSVMYLNKMTCKSCCLGTLLTAYIANIYIFFGNTHFGNIITLDCGVNGEY